MKKLFWLFALPFMLAAHDAWVVKNTEGYRVVYGHGHELIAYDPTKVKSLKIYGAGLKPAAYARSAHQHEFHFLPAAAPVMMTLHFDNGIWTKTPSGWENKPKSELKEAIESGHSEKFAKMIFAWEAGLSKPTGDLALEIVPLSNPLDAQAKTVRFEVLHHGKPVQNAVIETGEHGRGFKSEGAVIEVPAKPGFNLISAAVKLPGDQPGLDHHTLTAVLVYDRGGNE